MTKFADRVKETTTTTGTGAITLAGAVSQFETFNANFPSTVGDSFFYAIVGQTGTEWEVGEGHLSAATTLVRDVVLQSSNADALVSFSAGTKDVFCDHPSKFVNQTPTYGQMIAAISGANMP